MSQRWTQSNPLAPLRAPTTRAGLLRGPAHASPGGSPSILPSRLVSMARSPRALRPRPFGLPGRDRRGRGLRKALRSPHGLYYFAGCQVEKTPPNFRSHASYKLRTDTRVSQDGQQSTFLTLPAPKSQQRCPRRGLRLPSPARSRLGAQAAHATGRPGTPFQLPELQIPGCLSDSRSLPPSLAPSSSRPLPPGPCCFGWKPSGGVSEKVWAETGAGPNVGRGGGKGGRGSREREGSGQWAGRLRTCHWPRVGEAAPKERKGTGQWDPSPEPRSRAPCSSPLPSLLGGRGREPTLRRDLLGP